MTVQIIKQIFIILLFYVIGESISLGVRSITPVIYIPGTILGMLLLLLFLLKKYIKMRDVQDVGTFLTNNMAFFFIPAAVSVMEYYDLLRSTFLYILIIIFISAIVTFLAVAYSVKLTMYLQNKRNREKEVS